MVYHADSRKGKGVTGGKKKKKCLLLGCGQEHVWPTPVGMLKPLS